MDVFIKSAQAITAQNTFDTDEFLLNIEKPQEGYFSVINPNYKEYISAKQLRRMSKIIRIGVACSKKVLETAKTEQVDAIIIGTGLGCLTDTIKFLNNMNDNDEKLLNPTAFIQSTHNTVSGQIALLLNCKNYNFTFSQQSVSFETALLDAFIKLQDEENSNILLGGLDEITSETFEYYQKLNCTKNYIPGEGASFFALTNKKSDDNTAKILGLSNFNTLFDSELPSDLQSLLSDNNLSKTDIDIIISGENFNDINKYEYQKLNDIFNNSSIIKYKDIVGEYDTASAFAMWLASKIIEQQTVPNAILSNDYNDKQINNILIHNFSKEHNHSFILLTKC